MYINKFLVFTLIYLISCNTYSASTAAQKQQKAEEKAETEAKKDVASDLKQFGFGPAFYVISYDEEIFNDSKDVKLRGDGTVATSGTNFSTSIGVEVHYGFTFSVSVHCYKIIDDCTEKKNYKTSSGHIVSPFLGLYDLDNGVNGIAIGLLYGYWKGDSKLKNRTTLNVALGWTVHKDRLVLSDDVQDGQAPPASLNSEDYTKRMDVEGITLMVSATLGF